MWRLTDMDPANLRTYLNWCVYLFRVEPGRIAALPVGSSKGLEFDAVVVVEDEMTPNEKYVAFTRSLETLIVSRLPLPSAVEFDGISRMGRISMDNL